MNNIETHMFMNMILSIAKLAKIDPKKFTRMFNDDNNKELIAYRKTVIEEGARILQKRFKELEKKKKNS